MNLDFTSRDLKIVFVGSASVGKTSLINRYCHNSFHPETLSTIGVSFFSHHLTVGDSEVTLMIWDTAGEERFRSVAPSLIRGSDGLVLVFDLTSPQSLDDADIYFDMFLQTVEIPDPERPPVLLLGNKKDLTDENPQLRVSGDAVAAWCERRHVTLCESVSAKTGENVDTAMRKLAEELVLDGNNRRKFAEAVHVEPGQGQGSRTCC